MATYVIGDVQGCFAALQSLLARLNYRRDADRLWFTGDLVNRGPQSLEVLRWVKDQGPSVISVLGNHDLHLLAVAVGQVTPKPRDTLQPILAAPDRSALLDWLRQRPLLHRDPDLGYTLVHAGLLPTWDIGTASDLAREVGAQLRDAASDWFGALYGDRPDQWHQQLRGSDRTRVVVNAFTRLRFCDGAGRMDLAQKGAPGTQPGHLYPWFQVPGRRSSGERIIFGHWSTLGLHAEAGVIGLDSGCVWGRALSAVRIDVTPAQHFSVPCTTLT